MIYRMIRAYFRTAMRLYYSAIEIEGAERVPTSGPVLILSNHPNALIDPLAAVMVLERPVSLTAKHTLAKTPGIGWLMRAVGVVTFQRQQDVAEGASIRGNLASFREIHARLASGGTVLIFPEGRSHSEPSLSRFKRGAAKIALSYVEDGDKGGLIIVPVGLTYEDKARYRSRVHVRFGEPIDVAKWSNEHDSNDRALTKELMTRVGACTLQFESDDEASRFLNAAAIVQTDGQAPPTTGRRTGPLGERIDLARRLQAGADALSSDEKAAAAVDELVGRVDRYRSQLDDLGLRPSEAFLSMRPALAARFIVREIAIVVFGLPIALFAAAAHAVPFFVTRIIARRLASSEDQMSSAIIFSGFVAFPLTYLILLAVALWRMPFLWAALFCLVLLPSLSFTVGYRSRIADALRRSKTFIRFAKDRALKDDLAAEGQEINRLIRELAGRVEQIAGENGQIASIRRGPE